MGNMPIASDKARTLSRMTTRIRGLSLIGILVLLCVVFTILNSSFLTVTNILNVIRQVSMIGITAVSMTIVIIIGGIDLSVGSVVAFCGIMACMLFTSTGSMLLSVVGALLAGTTIGFFNGFVSAKGRIAGFITTLATMSIIRGFSFIITGGYPISVLDPKFVAIGAGYIGPIPIPVLIMAGVVILGYFVTQQTRFGRYVYALGGNEQATKWSGINVDKIKVVAYTLNGALAALSGTILAGRLGSGQPTAGNGFEMDVIAGVIVGGTSLSGGSGSILGTLIGVLLIGIINNGMDIMNVSTYYQMTVKGFIIIVAVFIDNLTKHE